jgi:mRNA-degrading endonuclease RelE of RelBE toxin-antitoxin system
MDYECNDSFHLFQKDLESLPPRIRKDFIKKKKLLRKNPSGPNVRELFGGYEGKFRIILEGNYRYVFAVNVNSLKIYSYEVKPRSQSYKG